MALARYSDSICHHREKKLSSERHIRSTGPAPSFEPRSKTERNIAKLEVTAVHSVAGILPPGEPLVRRAPYCAPHHSA
ncbi:hypothetical protein ACWDNT_17620, partial [Streptomyces sp. NPDC000963]